MMCDIYLVALQVNPAHDKFDLVIQNVFAVLKYKLILAFEMDLL